MQLQLLKRAMIKYTVNYLRKQSIFIIPYIAAFALRSFQPKT